MRLRGPVLSSIAACSTGLHAVLRAVQWLQDGTGHVVIAGAAESGLNPLFAGAFLRMGVLATDHRLAAHACRPFDHGRSGFIIGEGAAALVIETAEHARRRGGRPLAIIRGYALGADPAGLTEPDPCGAPLAGVIRRCLRSAGSAPERVACIKAHGTGTRQNDPAETAAIHAAFGVPGPPTVSFKGHLGHALGASGAIEAAILTKAIAADIIPPTANLRHPDPACGLNHPTVPAPIFRPGVDQILCLSAGLGGHLGAMLLGPPSSAT